MTPGVACEVITSHAPTPNIPTCTAWRSVRVIAAIATVFSNFVAMAMGLYMLGVHKKMLLGLSHLHWHLFGDSTKRLLFIAIPAGLTTAISPFVNTIIIGQLSGYGQEAVAAFGIATRVEAFAFIILMALAVGMSPIIGQNFGARNFDRVHEALRKAIGHFDITGEYDKVKAKVLYVIAPNDKLFPGTMCPAYAQAMRSAGIDITYCELVTDKGHLASHADARQWAPMLEAFLARL